MNSFTVRTRLLIGFITIALLGALVAAIGIYNMAKMNAQAEMAYQHDLMGLSHLKEANINLIYIGRAMRGTLLSTDSAQKQEYSTGAAKALGTMHDELDIARPLYVTASGKTLFAHVDRLVLEYQPIFLKTVQMSQSEEPEARRAAVEYGLGSFAEKGNQLHDALMELAHQKEKAAAAAAAMAGDIYTDARALLIALVLGSLAAGISLGLWITHSLMRQLGGEPAYAADVVASIAAGDLSRAVTTAPADKSSLLFAMEMMRTSLTGIVSQVREGTDTIATASSQIAAGNLDLSSRTEEQASSLEETASSMEELTSTVKQNADNARQANTLAVSASAVAVRGGDVVSKVVDTMASINASSKKIVDIISVIDSIAFQTNILALNAAVEAARAGEQGRGFAVVATEVRNLAQRSAAAAKEIKTLINDSVDKVDAGGKLVNQAGVTMAEIVDSITRVTDIMAEIASASIEQTMGIEQVNSAISQMDEVTQQNAALVEEAAAAAGAMQEQATALAEVVSIFKLGQEVTVKGIIPIPLRAVERVTVSVNPAARIGATKAIAARRAPMVANGGTENWEQF